MGSAPSVARKQPSDRTLNKSHTTVLERSPTNAAEIAGGGGAAARLRGAQNKIKRRETQHTIKAQEVHDEEKGEIRVNQYTLTELMGQGAYGKVYKTVDRDTGVVYACKVMRKSQLKRKRIGRFKNELDNVAREIAVWKKLKNPYVVDCVEVIDDPTSDSIYIVSEFMNGAAIRPNSLTCDPVDGETLQDWSSMIVAGLHYLHLNDVIHRDVKPANVLLHTLEDGETVVKLGDFGLSQQHEQGQDAVSNTVGTTAFMAPETFTGEEFSGKRTDIWALGVTLFMLAFGQLPWEVSLYTAADDILESELAFPEYAEVTVPAAAAAGDAPVAGAEAEGKGSVDAATTGGSAAVPPLVVGSGGGGDVSGGGGDVSGGGGGGGGSGGASEGAAGSAAATATKKKRVHVSDALKDLISKLLDKDPAKRPMCDEIIQHPYFTDPRTPRGTPIPRDRVVYVGGGGGGGGGDANGTDLQGGGGGGGSGGSGRGGGSPPRVKSRPTSAVKAASNIRAVEKVRVSDADIESAFTARTLAKMMRSKSIAVVRLQSLHRSVTAARAAAQLRKGQQQRHSDGGGGGGGNDADHPETRAHAQTEVAPRGDDMSIEQVHEDELHE